MNGCEVLPDIVSNTLNFDLTKYWPNSIIMIFQSHISFSIDEKVELHLINTLCHRCTAILFVLNKSPKIPCKIEGKQTFFVSKHNQLF